MGSQFHIDEAPCKTDIALMADETESLALRLLREIRTAQEATDAKLDAFMAERRAANAKLEAKLDKLNIELAGVKGRVRSAPRDRQGVGGESPLR